MNHKELDRVIRSPHRQVLEEGKPLGLRKVGTGWEFIEGRREDYPIFADAADLLYTWDVGAGVLCPVFPWTLERLQKDRELEYGLGCSGYGARTLRGS